MRLLFSNDGRCYYAAHTCVGLGCKLSCLSATTLCLSLVSPVCRVAGTIPCRATTASHTAAAASSVSHATATFHGTDARPNEPPTASRLAYAQTAPCYVQQPCPAESACHADVEPDATSASPYVAFAPAKPHDASPCRSAAIQCSSTVCVNTPTFLPWSRPNLEYLVPFVTRVQQLRRQQRQRLHAK